VEVEMKDLLIENEGDRYNYSYIQQHRPSVHDNVLAACLLRLMDYVDVPQSVRTHIENVIGENPDISEFK
jgi:hypothetical protein